MKEIWKPIREYRCVVAEVSNKGRIRTRSKRTGEIRSRPFKGYFNKWTGYYQIRGGLGVHRLVAEAFIPNPDGKQQVGHRNDDRTDNRAENLEWIDRPENNNTYRANMLRRQAYIDNRKAADGKEWRHFRCRVRGYDKEGMEQIWVSAHACARDLGCSHVLVLNCLNHKLSAKRAKGWTLEWIEE